MKTRVSSKTLGDLLRIGSLDAETRESLRRALVALPKQLYPFDAFSAEAERCLSSVDEDQRKGIAKAITSLLFVIGASPEDSADSHESVAAALREVSSTTPDVVDRTIEFIASLTSCSDLLVSFKATALYEESERLLIGSKLIVDVRPVFDPTDDQGGVVASALLYRLRLAFRVPSLGEVETIIFTLRDEELQELRSVIERASIKTRLLKDTKNFGPYLESIK